MLKKVVIVLSGFILLLVFSIIYTYPKLGGQVKLYFDSYSSNASERDFSLLDIFKCRRTGECATYLLSETSKEKIFKKLDVKELFLEKIPQGTSYYGYSSKISSFILINDEKVNMQVFVCESYIKVGIPIIYGSF